MKEKLLKKILGNLLIKGSLIILLSSVFSNIGSYLYHLSMGRILGPADYGILESLISIFYFLAIPIGVLNIIIIKFISNNSSDKKKISLFVKQINEILIKYGFLYLIMFLISFPLLKNILKIDSFFLFALVGISFFLGNFHSCWTAVLQGKLKFLKVGFSSILLSWSKFLFALFFVLVGLKTFGAIGAILISTIVSGLLCLKFISEEIDLKIKGFLNIKDAFNKIGNYSFSVFISNISFTSIYTVDIILARYFLPSDQAGYYAALSVLGKIVFFASSPIVSVMFPIISERQSKGNSYRKVLFLSIGLVITISFLVLTVYGFFPKLMIQLLYGEKYLAAADNLFIFGIFISIYSLCSLLINFFLSVSKLKAVSTAFTAAVIQIILICFFHKSILEILRVNIITVVILITSLLVYYFRNEKKERIAFGYNSGLQTGKDNC